MRRRQNEWYLLEKRSFLVSWAISNSLKCRPDYSSNEQSMRTQWPFVPNTLLDLLNIHRAFPWQNSFWNEQFAFQADWWRSSTLQLCSAFTENFDSPSSISHSIPDHYYVFCLHKCFMLMNSNEHHNYSYNYNYGYIYNYIYNYNYNHYSAVW